MCIDDYSKYKLFGERWSDIVGSIQLEVTACDPSTRADPSTCETDEAKIRDYIDRSFIRIDLATNIKNYNSQEYKDKTINSKFTYNGYFLDTSKRDIILWQTSFNTIESEETFLPLTSDPTEYEFFQTT